MKILKNIEQIILSCLVIILCILIIYIFSNPIKALFVVKSNSMTPTFSVNDLLITTKNTTYNIGDIVTFKDSFGDIVTHRIINIKQTDEETVYQTKGDSNNCADFNPITTADIIGKVIYIIKMKNIYITIFIGFLVLMLLAFTKVSYSKYQQIISQNIEREIQSPILEIESFQNVSELNKQECYFKVKNSDGTNISQNNLKYSIQIPNQNQNLEFKLFKENVLIPFDNNVSEEFILEAFNEHIDNFKVEIVYSIDDNLDIEKYCEDIEIKVQSYQI